MIEPESEEIKTQKQNIALKIMLKTYPILLLIFYIGLLILFTFQNFLILPSKNFKLPKKGQNLLNVGNGKFEFFMEDRDIFDINNKNRVKGNTDLLYFSGNAEYFNEEYSFMLYIAPFLEYNFIQPIYRGYGSSKGIANEINLMLDLNIINGILKKRGKKVIIVGFSIGSGPAIYLNKLHGAVSKLILINPLASLPIVLSDIPILKYFSHFLVDKWENIKRLKQNNETKIVILFSEWDEVIGNKNSHMLKEICNAKLVQLKKEYHNLNLFCISSTIKELLEN